MNRMAGPLAGVLVVVLLLGAGAVWLAQTYEWIPVTHRSPPVPSVAADPWTAFVRGLAARGEVSRYTSLDEVDRDEAGLVVARWPQLSAEDPQDWIGWIQSGGRLVVVVEPKDDWSGRWTETDLLAPLKAGGAPEPTEGEPLRVQAGEAGASVAVAPGSWWTGGHPDVSFGRPGTPGAALLVWNLGSGWLMLSGPLDSLGNTGLEDEGNRRFAASLIDGLDPEQLWIPAAPPVDPKTKTAGTNTAGPLWFGLAVLGVLLLWSLGPRLGPVLFSGEAPRLGLAERLRAEGRFLWDRRLGRDLLGRLPGAEPPAGKLTSARFIQAVARWVRTNAPPKRNSHDD